MPNRYKFEGVIVDNFESINEEPMDIGDIKEEIKSNIEENENFLEIEGEINVSKIEENKEEIHKEETTS